MTPRYLLKQGSRRACPSAMPRHLALNYTLSSNFLSSFRKFTVNLWKSSTSEDEQVSTPLWAPVYLFVHEVECFEFREPWFQIPAWSLSSETVSQYGTTACLISPICKTGQCCEDHWGMRLESVQLREQVSDRQWILLSPKLPLISHILGPP